MTSEAQTSLCYREAHRQYRAGNITWERYLHDMLLHAFVDLHECDKSRLPPEGLKDDLFGYSLWKWRWYVNPYVKEVAQLEAPFLAYHHGHIEDTFTKLDSIENVHTYMRASIALLALQRRDVVMLKAMLQREGFDFEDFFEEEAEGIDREKDPEIWSMLESSTYGRMRRAGRIGKDKRPEDRSLIMATAMQFDAWGIYPGPGPGW